MRRVEGGFEEYTPGDLIEAGLIPPEGEDSVLLRGKETREISLEAIPGLSKAPTRKLDPQLMDDDELNGFHDFPNWRRLIPVERNIFLLRMGSEKRPPLSQAKTGKMVFYSRSSVGRIERRVQQNLGWDEIMKIRGLLYPPSESPEG